MRRVVVPLLAFSFGMPVGCVQLLGGEQEAHFSETSGEADAAVADARTDGPAPRADSGTTEANEPFCDTKKGTTTACWDFDDPQGGRAALTKGWPMFDEVALGLGAISMTYDSRPAAFRSLLDATHDRSELHDEVSIGTYSKLTLQFRWRADECPSGVSRTIARLGLIGSASEFPPLNWGLKLSSTGFELLQCNQVTNQCQAALPIPGERTDWLTATIEVSRTSNTIAGSAWIDANPPISHAAATTLYKESRVLIGLGLVADAAPGTQCSALFDSVTLTVR